MVEQVKEIQAKQSLDLQSVEPGQDTDRQLTIWY
jgi:hypothetical protein